MPARQIPQQCHHGADQQADGTGNREGERQEPVPAGGKVDIQQVQPDGHEIDGDKDYRIGMAEPQRQRYDHIQQRHAAGGVSRPDDGTVDPPVAQDKQDRRQQCQYRQDKQHTGAADLLTVVSGIGRVRRLTLRLRQIGVKDTGAAQGTDLFAVRQRHAAFDTKHKMHSFPAPCQR